MRRGVHTVVTPEGPLLQFRLASEGDRATAFLIDLLFQCLVLVLVVVLNLLLSCAHLGIGFVVFLLVGFALRFFYFSWFEIRWQGRTPGKRRLGLRVIDAAGGPLAAEAVFARNLTREIEFFVPLTMLFAPDLVLPGEAGAVRLLSSLWLLVFLFFPLLNPGRVRLGDLVGGTRVVVAPKAILPPDLARAFVPLAPPSGAPPPVAREFEFTREHLDVYGVYELQVLEEVLRKARRDGAQDAIIAVSESIRVKIGYPELAADPKLRRRFLEAFYAAERRHLERQLLFGNRRERKKGTVDGTSDAR